MLQRLVILLAVVALSFLPPSTASAKPERIVWEPSCQNGWPGLFAEDGQFLGTASPAWDICSIANSSGMYGGSWSMYSIRAEWSQYGGTWSSLSPYSTWTTTPPILVTADYSDYRYVTINQWWSGDAPTIHPDTLIRRLHTL